MIERLQLHRFAQAAVRLAGWVQNRLAPALRQRRTFGAAVLVSLLAALYWGLIASDRYVSEARVIIQRTDPAAAQAVDVGSLLGNGNGGGANRADQLLLRDYLLSVDMLRKLDAQLKLREHYSDWRRDPLSRLWFKDSSLEWFHRHYLSRVSVEFDDYAGVLVIRAQAYNAEKAHAIAGALVEEGARYMNAMAQLSELQARRSAVLGYLSPRSAVVITLDRQIAAIEQQIAQGQPHGKGRIEAMGMLRKISLLQTPTHPQYPLEPRRVYNTAIFILAALLLAGIVHLLAVIVRDHRD